MSQEIFQAMIWSILLSEVFLCIEYDIVQNDCLENNFVIEGTYENMFLYLLTEHIETKIIAVQNINLFTL